MKTESIPKKWQDPEKPGKIHDLTKKDLPVVAVFTSYPSIGRSIVLLNKDERQESTGQFKPVPGTGCKLLFKGYKLAVQNQKLLELLMASDYYARGVIRPDPEDPTGFWRQMGAVQVETIQVVKFESGTHPQFGDLKLETLKVEKDVEPLRIVN